MKFILKKYNSLIIFFALNTSKFFPIGKGFIPRLLSNLLLKYNDENYIYTNQNAKLYISKLTLDETAYIYRNNGTIDINLLNLCIKVLKKYDHKNRVFLDICANIGSLTLDIAKYFNDQIYIECFEPIAQISQLLNKSKNMNNFKNINIHNILIGDKVGYEKIYISKKTTLSSIKPRNKFDKNVKTRIDTLDNLLKIKGIKIPKLIKIDVEGAELLVLKGGIKLLSKFKPSVIFESDINQIRYRTTINDILSIFQKIGCYEIYGIGYNEIGRIEKIDKNQINSNIENFENFLALSIE